MKAIGSILVFVSSLSAVEVPSGLREVRVGLASNFSGVATNSYNPLGHAVRNGANLALIEVNEMLARKGLLLSLKELDYGRNILNVRKIVENAAISDLVAVVGYEFSDDALLAAPIHQIKKLPLLTPSASADRLSTFGPYIHQGTFRNSYQGEALANFATDRLKAKRMLSVVATNCAYCTDMAAAFAKEYEKLGGKVVSHISVLDDQTNFDESFSGIDPTTFDAILVPNQEITSEKIISSLLIKNINKPFLGGDGWRTLGKRFFDKSSKKEFRGYMTAHWLPDLTTKSSVSFVRKYKSRFSSLPTDSAALTYDAIHLIGYAILKAKTPIDRQSVEDALTNNSRFLGVTGNYLYKKGMRSPQKSILILRSDKAGFEIEAVLEPKRNG